jgi:hypothetical protein
VIRGFDEGLVGMCLGERAKLVVPSELGYGARGALASLIPGGATLNFDVEVMEINGARHDGGQAAQKAPDHPKPGPIVKDAQPDDPKPAAQAQESTTGASPSTTRASRGGGAGVGVGGGGAGVGVGGGAATRTELGTADWQPPAATVPPASGNFNMVSTGGVAGGGGGGTVPRGQRVVTVDAPLAGDRPSVWPNPRNMPAHAGGLSAATVAAQKKVTRGGDFQTH